MAKVVTQVLCYLTIFYSFGQIFIVINDHSGHTGLVLLFHPSVCQFVITLFVIVEEGEAADACIVSLQKQQSAIVC